MLVIYIHSFKRYQIDDLKTEKNANELPGYPSRLLVKPSVLLPTMKFKQKLNSLCCEAFRYFLNFFLYNLLNKTNQNINFIVIYLAIFH